MHKKQTAVPHAESAAGKVRRRNLLGGGAAAAAAVAIPLQPLLGAKASGIQSSVVPYNANTRTEASFKYRTGMARAERIDVGVQLDNGDAETFTDFSGNY